MAPIEHSDDRHRVASGHQPEAAKESHRPSDHNQDERIGNRVGQREGHLQPRLTDRFDDRVRLAERLLLRVGRGMEVRQVSFLGCRRPRTAAAKFSATKFLSLSRAAQTSSMARADRLPQMSAFGDWRLAHSRPARDQVAEPWRKGSGSRCSGRHRRRKRSRSEGPWSAPTIRSEGRRPRRSCHGDRRS